MKDLFLMEEKVSRSISPENLTGEKGKGGMAQIPAWYKDHPARELGVGWKVSPTIFLKPGDTATLADIEGMGIINHLWFTTSVRDVRWRHLILRMYWDDQENPSVECPLGDFFCSTSIQEYAQLSSLPVCVNAVSGMNCYWPMPFRKRARLTLSNIGDFDVAVFYQVDYDLCEVEENAAYFHAQFRRVNPLPYKQVYTVVDGIRGKGKYVGTYFAWGVNNRGWWGEGEIKFYMDGDTDFPTICGTGTEDYICGSYNFEDPQTHKYKTFTTPYSGLHRVIVPDGVYNSQMRFGMYRWHVADPIYFEQDLRVTIQALGWRSSGRYLPLQDDIASVAYWYQTLPTAPFPALPDADYLEEI